MGNFPWEKFQMTNNKKMLKGCHVRCGAIKCGNNYYTVRSQELGFILAKLQTLSFRRLARTTQWWLLLIKSSWNLRLYLAHLKKLNLEVCKTIVIPTVFEYYSWIHHFFKKKSIFQKKNLWTIFFVCISPSPRP